MNHKVFANGKGKGLTKQREKAKNSGLRKHKKKKNLKKLMRIGKKEILLRRWLCNKVIRKKLPFISLLDNWRSEEHTSELQSRFDLVCRLLLEKKNKLSN